MPEELTQIVEIFTFEHSNILFLIGLAVFAGTIGGKFFQIIKIPQVVGYIVLGIIIGTTGLEFIDQQTLAILEPFNFFALGLIGFMIGGELKKDVLRKHGKEFLFILVSEGLAAFILVSISITFVCYLLLHNWGFAISLGILLGAISSATAPAATVDVLWEYKSAGPLTNAVLAIVALDDGLALLLFVIAVNMVNQLFGGAAGSIVQGIVSFIYEIAGAIIVGVLFGMCLSWILNKNREQDRVLTFSLGTLLILVGLAIATGIDMILATMTLGMTLVNMAPKLSKEVFKLIKDFTPPIYVLFFVLIGAKLNLTTLSLVMVILIIVFVIARSVGKMFGARFGAAIAGAHYSVRQYLPYCLFSQAGVAIGLSILAGQHFPGELGTTIVTVITGTTFIVQLLGPPFVKYAVQKSGESGLNITENDIIKTSLVRDVMDKNIVCIPEKMRLSGILQIMSEHPNFYFPVVEKDNKLLGVITIENLKNTFIDQGMHDIIIAFDLMEPAQVKVSGDTMLQDALGQMRVNKLHYMPVVENDGVTVAGFIETRMVYKLIANRFIDMKKKINGEVSTKKLQKI